VNGAIERVDSGQCEDAAIEELARPRNVSDQIDREDPVSQLLVRVPRPARTL
jgi:hypothetical protein